MRQRMQTVVVVLCLAGMLVSLLVAVVAPGI